MRCVFAKSEDRSKSEFGRSPTRKLCHCTSVGQHMFHCLAARKTQAHQWSCLAGALKWSQKTSQNMFQHLFNLFWMYRNETHHFLSIQICTIIVCMFLQCPCVFIHLFIWLMSTGFSIQLRTILGAFKNPPCLCPC